MPLVDNPARVWKKAAFTQMFGPKEIVGRSAVNDRYHYTRWTGPRPGEELYGHTTDPREFTNLASSRQHAAALLTRMRGVLDAGWKAARATV